MLKDLVKIANKLDSLGLTKIADEIDGMIKKALDSVDSGDMGQSADQILGSTVDTQFRLMLGENKSTLGYLNSHMPKEVQSLRQKAYELCFRNSFVPKDFFFTQILPAYNKIKSMTDTTLGPLSSPLELKFENVSSFLSNISDAMKKFHVQTEESSFPKQVSDSSAPAPTTTAPSNTNATKWQVYFAKTNSPYAKEIERAWELYCTYSTMFPPTYDGFVAWWKAQKAKGVFKQGGNIEETYKLLIYQAGQAKDKQSV